MKFHNREAWQIENDALRVTVLRGGGHIAEILDKRTGVSPLWVPPWPSIDPTEYCSDLDTCYGRSTDSKLLSGIMGHNLCLDTFGPPSEEQIRAGISVHGEAPISEFDGAADGGELHVSATLPISQLRVRRSFRLSDDAAKVHVRESVENLLSIDRPIAWTQHVTLGPPFVKSGETQLHIVAPRSKVFENAGFDAGRLMRGADFAWPNAPTIDGTVSALTTFAASGRCASLTTHLMDRASRLVSFAAYSRSEQLVFGYTWNPRHFPWIALWEEDRSRTVAPWNAETVACGFEFGVSPYPETNAEMIRRDNLFGVPTFRTLRAREQATVDYFAFFRAASDGPHFAESNLD